MDWLAEVISLPKGFTHKYTSGLGGGFLQNSASDSIHNSILAARHRYLEQKGCYSNPSNEISQHGNAHPGTQLVKMVAYVNKQAHSSVQKGANLALCTIRLLEPNEYDSINGDILERQILTDVQAGLTPFYCCASLGTTGACAFDDLKSIGPICQKYKMWLHVDAAYAGSAFICPEFRYLMEGIDNADSIETNAYKFMLGAIDYSCLYVKDRACYSRVFTVNHTFPEYLMGDLIKEQQSNQTDYRHFGISTTRRMRALKMFMVFRRYGTKYIQEYIRNTIKLAKHFEELVKSDNRFEVTNKVYMGLVCFRQKP